MLYRKYFRSGALAFICLALLAAAPAHGNAPALWRVADADSEIWLFGTVHMLPQHVRWRSPAFDRAFAAADTVFLEADLTAAPRRGFRATIMQLGRNANFVTLSSLLGSRDTERLARAAERLGIPPGQLEPLRPWLASIRLSLTSMAAQGFESRSGVDGIIADMTRAAGKRLGYLETVQEQFEIFAALSPAAEKTFLMATVAQVEEGPSGGLAELVTAWSEGDTNRFDRQFQATLGGDLPELRNALFIDRNRRWTQRIARLMKGAGKALIAVGAGHLAGDDGVVGLLRAKGYRVSRQ
ncbi:MAG: TraB/GumN family protein [Rhodospirillaceae bacterium]|nr:TraB/GumN family protein [Rhodospirillaceae bacterium]